MKVLITGINGFIGRNLEKHLRERERVEILRFDRGDNQGLAARVAEADCIFHLAGVNRPQDPKEFAEGNADFTLSLCSAIEAAKRNITIVYASSIQATLDNPYGRSKLEAEATLRNLASRHAIKLHILRLPNVFGKWARPNYNSVVATFCYNVARDIPISINDPAAPLSLVYIDDVVSHFLAIMDQADGTLSDQVQPVYVTTVGELAAQITAFKASRESLVTEPVGNGLARALYSTYLSYLPVENFDYEIPSHRDARGVFVEMLKTKNSGQFSYFTAYPGVTRGGHYHHSKTEKFLVIKGVAKFRFRNILNDDYYELLTTGEKPVVVETVPGWTHDITNIGSDEMIVMLWANEIFDRDQPDTYTLPLAP